MVRFVRLLNRILAVVMVAIVVVNVASCAKSPTTPAPTSVLPRATRRLRTPTPLPTLTAHKGSSAKGTQKTPLPTLTASPTAIEQVTSTPMPLPGTVSELTVYKVGYWPGQSMWLVSIADSSLLGLPVNRQDMGATSWRQIMVFDPITPVAISGMTQLSDGRLVTGMLVSKMSRSAGREIVTRIGVLEGESWHIIPVPSAQDGDVAYGLAPLNDGELVVAFPQALWSVSADTEEWHLLDSPQGCEGTYYDVESAGKYGLFLSTSDCGIWRLLGSEWQPFSDQGLRVTEMEVVGHVLYYLVTGEGLWSQDLATGRHERVDLPTEGDRALRTFAGSEDGFLYQSSDTLHFCKLDGSGHIEFLLEEDPNGTVRKYADGKEGFGE
jgi:hypothetical protein